MTEGREFLQKKHYSFFHALKPNGCYAFNFVVFIAASYNAWVYLDKGCSRALSAGTSATGFQDSF
jgi:hypothetical protein